MGSNFFNIRMGYDNFNYQSSEMENISRTNGSRYHRTEQLDTRYIYRHIDCSPSQTSLKHSLSNIELHGEVTIFVRVYVN